MVATSETDTRQAVAHLVRRVAFGATPERIDELAALGYEGAVGQLTDHAAIDAAATAIAPPEFDTDAYLDVVTDGGADVAARQEAQRRIAEERRELLRWWLRRMVVADQPHREFLTFVWHDHFATSLAKVKLAELMYDQCVTLYDSGGGRFDDLVGAIARDPAMLIWLDGRRNTAAAPNENFARELFELFTLGHGAPGHEGHGGQPYTERDVSEAARALTGWTINRQSGGAMLRPRRHDTGTKTVLGVTGNLGLDDVVAIATGHPACAPHVVAQLWSRFARPAAPDDPVVAELATPFADDFDVTSLLRRMFLHPEFLARGTRSALVKMPVQFAVGTARALGIELPGGMLPVLRNLGQAPLFPPDVDGWPANAAWISTSTTQARMALALAFAEAATGAVDTLDGTPAAERPDAVAHLLGIDAFGSSSLAALEGVRANPKNLLAIAIAAPEHALA